jgi:hypothetical protein
MVDEQGLVVRNLKADKTAEKAKVDEAVQKLLTLKGELNSLITNLLAEKK